jgi:hypothetical protein
LPIFFAFDHFRGLVSLYLLYIIWWNIVFCFKLILGVIIGIHLGPSFGCQILTRSETCHKPSSIFKPPTLSKKGETRV